MLNICHIGFINIQIIDTIFEMVINMYILPFLGQ